MDKSIHIIFSKLFLILVRNAPNAVSNTANLGNGNSLRLNFYNYKFKSIEKDASNWFSRASLYFQNINSTLFSQGLQSEKLSWAN